MYLKASLLDDLSNTTNILISPENCRKLGINCEDYHEEQRFTQIKYGGAFVWHTVCFCNDLDEETLLIPNVIANNLPNFKDGAEIFIEKYTPSNRHYVQSISLEKIYPSALSLAVHRDYIINIIRGISYPLLRSFQITIPLQLATKEIIQSVFVIKKIQLKGELY